MRWPARRPRVCGSHRRHRWYRDSETFDGAGQKVEESRRCWRGCDARQIRALVDGGRTKGPWLDVDGSGSPLEAAVRDAAQGAGF